MGNRQSAKESRQSPPSSQPRPPEESRQSTPSSSTHPPEESRQSPPSSQPRPPEESRQSPPSSSTHPLEESRQSTPSSSPCPFEHLRRRGSFTYLPPDLEESRQSTPSSSPCPFEHLRRRGSFTYLPPDLEESRQSPPSSSPCPSEESRQSPPSSSTHPRTHDIDQIIKRLESERRLTKMRVESQLLDPEESRQSPPSSQPRPLSELRVVLLGNSWSERRTVGNFILGENVFNTEEEPDCCQRVRGQWKEKEIVLINTPDLLHPDISEHKLTEHVENCVRLSDPGPHVFLLVLQPEDFTEEQRLRLKSILENISDRSFDHSLVLISTPREEQPGFMEQYRQHPPLKDVIRECCYRFLWRKDLELQELLTRLGQIVKENNGEHLNLR